MSGGWKRAKHAGRRPLDGRVRRLMKRRLIAKHEREFATADVCKMGCLGSSEPCNERRPTRNVGTAADADGFQLDVEALFALAQGFEKLEGHEKCVPAGSRVKVNARSLREDLDDHLALDPQLVCDVKRAGSGVRSAMLQRDRVILQCSAMRAEGHGCLAA